jgi:hypothetical protein
MINEGLVYATFVLFVRDPDGEMQKPTNAEAVLRHFQTTANSLGYRTKAYGHLRGLRGDITPRAGLLSEAKLPEWVAAISESSSLRFFMCNSEIRLKGMLPNLFAGFTETWSRHITPNLVGANYCLSFAAEMTEPAVVSGLVESVLMEYVNDWDVVNGAYEENVPWDRPSSFGTSREWMFDLRYSDAAGASLIAYCLFAAGQLFASPTTTYTSGISLINYDYAGNVILEVDAILDIGTASPNVSGSIYNLTEYDSSGAIIVDGSADDVTLNNSSTFQIDEGSVHELTLYDTTGAVVDGGTITSTTLYDEAGEIVQAGTVDNVTANNSSTITDDGGTVKTITLYDTAGNLIDSGTEDDVTGNNSSTITDDGGTVKTITLYDTAGNIINNGNVGTITNDGSGSVDIFGGTVKYAYDAGPGEVDVSGGNVNTVTDEGPGATNILGGTVKYAYDTGVGDLTISGGKVNTVTDEGPGETDILGATVKYAYDTAGGDMHIEGGNVTVEAGDSDSGNMYITGGTVKYVYDSGSGNVDVTGGTFGMPGIVDFLESGTGHFTFDGQGLGDTLSGGDGFGGFDYSLFGTLENGSNISGDLIDLRNGSPMFELENSSPAPETSSFIGMALALVSLGLLVWGKQKRKLSNDC